MLDSKIEEKIGKLFLFIAKGEKEIKKLKKIISEKYKINPVKLFNKIDVDEKGFFTKVDFESYLNNFKVNFSKNDIDIFFFFFDTNLDDYINLEEFIDFLIPNNNINKAWKNKVKKNKNDCNDYFIESESLNLFLQIFKEEKNFGEKIFKIVNEVKSSQDFSVESLFNILRGYLYISIESLSAFFDRKYIKYKKSDVENILNRIDRGNSCKISFNRFQSFFNFSDKLYPNNYQIYNTSTNFNNESNDNYYNKTTIITDRSNNYNTLNNDYMCNHYIKKKYIPKSRNPQYSYSNYESLINKYLNTEKPKDSLKMFMINSYFEKKIKKISNKENNYNHFQTNFSYEMNNCNHFPTEISINANNQNIFNNNIYNNTPIKISESVIIKPSIERRNCKYDI